MLIDDTNSKNATTCHKAARLLVNEFWRFSEPPTAATSAIAAHLSWEHHFATWTLDLSRSKDIH